MNKLKNKLKYVESSCTFSNYHPIVNVSLKLEKNIEN